MKIHLLILAIMVVSLTGCETVHKTTKTGGEYVGKGARSLGGITEGAAEGYKGEEENPYGR